MEPDYVPALDLGSALAALSDDAPECIYVIGLSGGRGLAYSIQENKRTMRTWAMVLSPAGCITRRQPKVEAREAQRSIPSGKSSPCITPAAKCPGSTETEPIRPMREFGSKAYAGVPVGAQRMGQSGGVRSAPRALCNLISDPQEFHRCS